MSTNKIGLETHIQLNTKTKLFCGCSTKEAEPNSNCCEICLGHPGSKPMFNSKALHYCLKLCLALGCKIEKKIAFSRKTYFYPDMSKNFQITQYEIPVGKNGMVKLPSGKKVEIERIHIEEDPAALLHDGSIAESKHVLIDYNRAGLPLCEIVTSPCMESPAEAREFLKELIRIIKYLHIFDEKSGTLKTDCNISTDNNPRVEIKNVSGFKDAERALNYELLRQKMSIKNNKPIFQETRAWTEGKTISLRSKETEADYGYIIEPDLPVFNITPAMLKKIKVPELAHIKAERYIKQFKLNPIDAEVMAMDINLAKLFEKVAAEIDPRFAAMWLRKELLRVLNFNKKSVKDLKFSAEDIIELLTLVNDKTISETTAQRIIEKMMVKKISPQSYIKKHNLEQISSKTEIIEICKKIIKSNKKALDDYRAGELKSFHYLVGQVMKVSKGKAEPGLVNKILKELVEK